VAARAPPDPNDPERVYRSVAVGDLVDLFLIDTRSRRDEPVAGESMWDPARTQLGHEQREWLLASFDESKAHWRILGNSSVLGHICTKRWPGRRIGRWQWSSSSGPTATDRTSTNGRLSGRAEDDLEHLRDRPVKDVVVLSGDVHVALALELTSAPFEPTGTPVAVEFVTASLTSQNVDEKMGWEPRTRSIPIEADLIDALPHLRWVDLDSHGYVVIDVDRERTTAHWWFVDTVLERTDGEHLGSSWTVEHGRPKLVRTLELVGEGV